MNENKNIKSLKIIGKTYDEIKKLVQGYAENDYPVIFIGERGVGKELFARYYMAKSNIKGNKLTINCSTFFWELLGSELFGHKAGSFTGAIKER